MFPFTPVMVACVAWSLRASFAMLMGWRKPPPQPPRPARPRGRQSGEMAERFKAAVLKTAVGSSPPWVRIPLSPPHTKNAGARKGPFFVCGERVVDRNLLGLGGFVARKPGQPQAALTKQVRTRPWGRRRYLALFSAEYPSGCWGQSACFRPKYGGALVTSRVLRR